MIGASIPRSGILRTRGYVSASGANWFVESILVLAEPIRLRLVHDGAELTLSWTGGSGPYQVQQNGNLSNSNSWQNTGPILATNSLRLPLTSAPLFLRVVGR